MSRVNPPRSLRIGVTIGLMSPNETLWNNGIKQNALFLAKLFRNSPFRHEVLLLNTTGVAISSNIPWDLNSFPTRQFDEACDGLDVVIELGGQISGEQTARIKRQGSKLISYCCGPEYVQNIEAMIFNRPLWSSIFINPDYDELWIIPQVFALNRGYLQTFRRCPARKAPFVWDPIAVESVAEGFPDRGEYRPTSQPKRLTVIEPNIDVLKFSLYPILISELAYRSAPESVGFLNVANSDRLALEEREFAGLMHHLDIVRANKACFIGRVQTPSFLAEHTDIVVSHQWGLPLNYFYLECCWQGYPLVHNADLIPELGYYYPEHELDAGADALLKAIRDHDVDWLGYRERQRNLIRRFLSTNPDLINAYDAMLFGLFS